MRRYRTLWALCVLLVWSAGSAQAQFTPGPSQSTTTLLYDTDCAAFTRLGSFCMGTGLNPPTLYVGNGNGKERINYSRLFFVADCTSFTQVGDVCFDMDVPITLYVGTGAGIEQVSGGGGAGDITAVGSGATGAVFQNEGANTVFAAPDGVAGQMTPRVLVAGDLPATVVREDVSNIYDAASVNDFGAAALEIPNSVALPATCTVGQLYADTDATTGQRLYLCQAANTWVLQGDGGGGASTFDAVMAAGNTYTGADNPATAVIIENGGATEAAEWYLDATTGMRLRYRVGANYQTLNERCEANGNRIFFLATGNNCMTYNCTTGVTTYAAEQSCRPAMDIPFTAASLDVDGTNCVRTDVALNGFPARPTISCADNDNGRMVLWVPRMPAYWAPGSIDVLLTAQSISSQPGATMVFDLQVVCTADNEVRAAAPATGTTNTVTITFGSQADDVQHSNQVGITTSGCAANEEMALIIDNEDAGTASQSPTTGVLLGGKIIAYRTATR